MAIVKRIVLISIDTLLHLFAPVKCGVAHLVQFSKTVVMAREKLGERMSLILDDETRQAIADTMQATGEKVAATLLRKAIKTGLPLLRSGGAADVLTLDGELSKKVDGELSRANETRDLLKEPHRTRNSMLLEAIGHGIEAVGCFEMIKESKAKHGLDDAMAHAILLTHDFTIHPEKRAVKVAMSERNRYWEQVFDLISHVPEARKRKEAIEKLIEIRIAAKEWVKVWGCGLSTPEILWQIAMHEKYGHDSSKWPKAEIEKRDREREREDKSRSKAEDLPDVSALAPAITGALQEPEKRDRLIEQARKRVEAGSGPIQPVAPVVKSLKVKPTNHEKPAKKKPGK